MQSTRTCRNARPNEARRGATVRMTIRIGDVGGATSQKRRPRGGDIAADVPVTSALVRRTLRRVGGVSEWWVRLFRTSATTPERLSGRCESSERYVRRWRDHCESSDVRGFCRGDDGEFRNGSAVDGLIVAERGHFG